MYKMNNRPLIKLCNKECPKGSRLFPNNNNSSINKEIIKTVLNFNNPLLNKPFNNNLNFPNNNHIYNNNPFNNNK